MIWTTLIFYQFKKDIALIKISKKINNSHYYDATQYKNQAKQHHNLKPSNTRVNIWNNYNSGDFPQKHNFAFGKNEPQI